MTAEGSAVNQENAEDMASAFKETEITVNVSGSRSPIVLNDDHITEQFEEQPG